MDFENAHRPHEILREILRQTRRMPSSRSCSASGSSVKTPDLAGMWQGLLAFPSDEKPLILVGLGLVEDGRVRERGVDRLTL